LGQNTFLVGAVGQPGCRLAAAGPDLPVAPADLARKGSEDDTRNLACVEVWRRQTASRPPPKASGGESRAVAGLSRALAGGHALDGIVGNDGGAGDPRQRWPIKVVAGMELLRRGFELGLVLGFGFAVVPLLRRSAAQRPTRADVGDAVDGAADRARPMACV